MVQLRVRLGPKGQIVIPKIFRNEINVYPGSEVIITLEPKTGVIIKKSTQDPIMLLEKISEEAAKRRKGKKLKINAHGIYEQYEKRARRAGL